MYAKQKLVVYLKKSVSSDIMSVKIFLPLPASLKISCGVYTSFGKTHRG